MSFLANDLLHLSQLWLFTPGWLRKQADTQFTTLWMGSDFLCFVIFSFKFFSLSGTISQLQFFWVDSPKVFFFLFFQSNCLLLVPCFFQHSQEFFLRIRTSFTSFSASINNPEKASSDCRRSSWHQSHFFWSLREQSLRNFSSHFECVLPVHLSAFVLVCFFLSLTFPDSSDFLITASISHPESGFLFDSGLDYAEFWFWCDMTHVWQEERRQTLTHLTVLNDNKCLTFFP